MALNSILRTSASRVAPLAARLIGGQWHFYRHHYALFSAAAVVTQINLSGELLPASFTSGRHYCSSRNRPSSDESLHKVIESEIVCAEESDVSNEVHEAPEGNDDNDSNDDKEKSSRSHIPPVVRVARSGFNKYLGMKPSAANLHPKIRGIKPITVINFFPKRTFIHFFLPRRPRRQIRRANSRLGKGWGALRKVGPIRCLHSRNGTEEERNEMRGRGTGKRVESISLDDSEKQNKIRIWPKKRQPIKNILSKLLRVSGAFKHPKYAGVVNDIDFLIKNDDSFRKTKFFKIFFSNPKKSGPKKSGSDSLMSHLPKRALLPAVRPSFHYSVMQYLLNTKNKMHFDPVVVLKHFLAPQSTKTAENSWRG